MGSQAVIFIPGIKGTKLANTNRVNFDTVWSGVQSNFETIGDLALTKKHNGAFYDENIDVILRADELEEFAYREFLRDLRPDNNQPIFIFNYDWRLSNVENGGRLKEFVAYLIAKSKADRVTPSFKKFDFITHSMGNHVLRAYMNLDGFANINKVVLTVPPFKGSLDIVSAVIDGEGSWVTGAMARMRKVLRTCPGAVELMPIYRGASQFENGDAHDMFNPNHWQGNIVLPDGDDSDEKKALKEKFIALLEQGKRDVANGVIDLMQLDPSDRKRILIVVRDGYKTPQSLNVKDEYRGTKNFFDLAAMEKNSTTDGDGRVSHASSSCYATPDDDTGILTVVIKKAWKVIDKSHGLFLNEERVQKVTNRFLFGSGTFDYQIPGNSIRRVIGLSGWKHQTLEDND